MENTNIIDKGAVFRERFTELVGNSTQEEVAQKVNTSRQNVGNWLNGKSRPDIFALSEIATGFNVSTDYLLGLTDIKSADTEIQGICSYTGLSEKALSEIKSCNRIMTTNNFKSDITETYKFINALNYLLESEFFYDFIKPLSDVYRYCKPHLEVDNSSELLNSDLWDADFDKMNEIAKLTEEYCYISGYKIVSNEELAELKLSYAQNALLIMFDELIRESFSDESNEE
jgi:transcriptional regulator with XRE-family HTH domain